jgi:phage FluMu gp28-like protein
MNDQPHFLPYQLRWINRDAQIKWWEKSRRIGATYVQSWEDVKDVVENEETGKMSQPKVWFSSADESAAREYIDYCEQWASLLNVAAEQKGRQVLDEDKNVKALTLELPGVGVIHALTSNPSRFRSKGGKAVVDEFAHHPDQAGMWDAVYPLTTWGNPLRILSTHHGKRLFWRMVEDTKAGKRSGAVQTTTIIDAVEEGLLDKIKGRVTSQEEREDWIDSIRRDCRDEEQWLQEYMCRAVDEADAFLTYDMIAAASDGGVLWGGSLQQNYDCEGALYLGVDIGRREDLTVFWLIEEIGPMTFTRKVKVMENAPFRAQWDVLTSFLDHPKLRRGCIDETGIGMQMAEDAEHEYGAHRVEKVSFTSSVKEELAYEFRRRIEEKTLVLPESQKVREDLHSVRKSVTSAGNLRFQVQGGDGHADRLWAAALSCHAASEYKGPVRVGSRDVGRPSTVAAGFAGDTDFSNYR